MLLDFKKALGWINCVQIGKQIIFNYWAACNNLTILIQKMKKMEYILWKLKTSIISDNLRTKIIFTRHENIEFQTHCFSA